MARIKVLSKEVSELIAAGEVIDRPSSVIKELLENSIDSGATNITVEIKNGGRTYMRITDNGCGISYEDLPTAFIRHATSKINEKEDLEKICSLGFRGEALASICAVSKVSVLTKQSEDQLGSRIENEGGEVLLLEECGCPDGTTIIVRDLFFNVPARLKFLKKDVTESNSIASIVNKIALSNPDISFKFIKDNKQELVTAGDGKLFSAIYSVFGKEFANSLLKADYTYNGVKVSGYVIKPLSAKGKRSFQNFFVNGRYVKSVTCMVSLEEAYKNQIMVGKFPACVLMLDIDPSLVDVNVHPAKIEVKFSNEKLIYDAVYFAVKNALMSEQTPSEMVGENTRHYKTSELFGYKTDDTVQLSFRSDKEPKKDMPKFEYVNEQAKPKADFFQNVSVRESKPGKGAVSGVLKVDRPEYAFSKKSTKATDVDNTNEEKNNEPETNGFKYINSESLKKKEIAEPKPEVEEKEEIFTRVLGEVFDTYIVCQRGNDMYLIDKHAAHERMNFESVKRSLNRLDCQMLLSPIEVLLSYDEYDAVIENIENAAELGFVLEDAKAPFIKVLGVPVIIDALDAEEAVSELARNYLEHMKNPQIDVLDELCHSIACKASIKGNVPSEIEELTELCEKVFDEDLVKYCPHGRPIFVKFSRTEIEKLFKRIV
ncbi:MAG: DNA mismatch repair endonuclease MutL [Ruminococcus sp.]|nr:DNA mismatch repair endonuclease MutL [Ruminococcus sp.]